MNGLPLFLSYSSFARKPPHALKGQKLLAQGIRPGLGASGPSART